MALQKALYEEKEEEVVSLQERFSELFRRLLEELQ
jgi:hypothetical protein